MADAEKKKEEKAPAPPKKSKKKLLIIIAAAVLVLGGGGFFAYSKVFAVPEGEVAENAQEETQGADAAKETKGGSEAGGEEAVQAESVMVEFSPFIVNLRDNSGTRYLKLKLNVELAPGSSPEVLKAQDSKIRDSIIILLTSKSYSDIGTVEGKYQLRDEVVMRINQFLPEDKVKTAYFTEFVIQ